MENQTSKKTRLLIATPLYPPEIGGPATYVKFLEENLPKDDFELTVVTFGEVKHLPYIIRHIVFFWKVFKRAKNADMVYALDPLGVGIPAGFAAKLRGKKFLLRIAGDRAWETAVQKFGMTESLDTFSESKKFSWKIKVLKFGQAFCAKMAEKIIVPSEYLRGVVWNWGTQKDKIFTVYNAFSPVVIPESKEELRRELSLSGRIIFSAGRLVPWKGFETLIRALPEMAESAPDLKLYIAGDGPEKEKLSEIVRSFHLEEKVVFLGVLPKEKLHRHIKAADVFVLNTSYEGFSHQLLEAMSLGTPVITTTSGGNPEMIETGKDGLLVTHDDTRAFVSAITLLLKEKKYAGDLAEEAKEKARTFHISRAVDGFLKIVKSLNR
jgi:glycosyltransferase involved in cell wall biosynthesis